MVGKRTFPCFFLLESYYTILTVRISIQLCMCVCVCALDKWMLDLLSRPDWLAIPTGTSSAAFASCFPRAPQLREPLEEESNSWCLCNTLEVLSSFSGWMKYRWGSGYYHPGRWEGIPDPVFPKHPEETLIWAAHRKVEASSTNGKWWLSAMHILTPLPAGGSLRHSLRPCHQLPLYPKWPL